MTFFELRPHSVYPLETAALLGHVAPRTVLVYCRHGLLSPLVDPESGGYCFDGESVRKLQRIEYLRAVHGVNMAGARMILELMNEVERLQAEVNLRRNRGD